MEKKSDGFVNSILLPLCPGSVVCREAKSITLPGTRMYVKTKEVSEECY